MLLRKLRFLQGTAALRSVVLTQGSHGRGGHTVLVSHLRHGGREGGIPQLIRGVRGAGQGVVLRELRQTYGGAESSHVGDSTTAT